MKLEEFLTLRPGDRVAADGTTGRVSGEVRAWLGDELLVRWGRGGEAYTHAVGGGDVGRLRLEGRAGQ